MIGVIDYGAGNVRSVCNALHRLSIPFFVCSTYRDIGTAAALILPGVGHFGQLSSALDYRDLRAPIAAALQADTPFLGICLGMQILFEASEESPGASGLGHFAGSVSILPSDVRVPHMGWNLVEPTSNSAADSAEFFYFAHSYAVLQSPEGTATCCYGVPFVAAVQRRNTFGVQFHPEKSGRQGERLLRRFMVVVNC